MLALQHLLKQDCGSCHGMTLRGGLGPSLLPQDLSTRSVTALTQKILWGVPQRGMPAWQPLLSEAEAAWLAEQLVNGASATP
jgi:cytochrome c55X